MKAGNTRRLRLGGHQRLAAAIALGAVVALLAGCSNTLASGSARDTARASGEKPITAADVPADQLQATIKRVIFDDIPASELPPVVANTLAVASIPLTAEQTDLLKHCLTQTSCETGHGTLTVGINADFTNNPWWSVRRAEATAQAIAYPQVKKIVFTTSSTGDVAEVLANLRSLIAQQVDFIVEDPIFGGAILPAAKLAEEAGIPFITENGPLNEAIRKTNQLIRQLNNYLASPRKKNLTWSLFRGDRDETVLREIKGSGKLTRNKAALNEEILSVAYKIEGRNIRRNDLLRSLSADLGALSRVKQIMNNKIALVDSSRASFAPEVKERVAELKRHLAGVDNLIAEAEGKKASVECDYLDIKDEPVAHVISPGDPCSTPSSPIWYPYKISFVSSHRIVDIQAKRFEVSTVTWLSSDVIELTFHYCPDTKFFVTPLQAIPEAEQADEAREGDVAILAGHFVVIVIPHNPPREEGERVMNFLRITAVEEPTRSKRFMNTREPNDTSVLY